MILSSHFGKWKVLEWCAFINWLLSTQVLSRLVVCTRNMASRWYSWLLILTSKRAPLLCKLSNLILSMHWPSFEPTTTYIYQCWLVLTCVTIRWSFVDLCRSALIYVSPALASRGSYVDPVLSAEKLFYWTGIATYVIYWNNIWTNEKDSCGLHRPISYIWHSLALRPHYKLAKVIPYSCQIILRFLV